MTERKVEPNAARPVGLGLASDRVLGALPLSWARTHRPLVWPGREGMGVSTLGSEMAPELARALGWPQRAEQKQDTGPGPFCQVCENREQSVGKQSPWPGREQEGEPCSERSGSGKWRGG